MLNLLEEYIQSSLPASGDFATTPALLEKVAQSGAFRPFYGNTTVFTLDDATKAELAKLQDHLYETTGELLAERIDPATFHMTLHDLVNSPELTESLLERMRHSEAGAAPLVAQWKDRPSLRMKTTWLFNMLGTSVVLGLAPADEESRANLDFMYTALHDVVDLGRGLTPHITMAYFKPGVYPQEEIAALHKALRPVDMTIELTMDRLELHYFRHMNEYTREKNW